MRLNKTIIVNGQLDQFVTGESPDRNFRVTTKDGAPYLHAMFIDRESVPCSDIEIRYNGYKLEIVGRDIFEQAVFSLELTPEAMRKITATWLTRVP